MLGTGGVAIFWDYGEQTIGIIQPDVIVNQIKEVVQQFGGIKLFKAYADLSILSSSHSLALRSELQYQTIIVDMLTYAMDHSTFDVILLISGDRDFALRAQA
ncbi:hypothetical protein MPER_07310 [Moniliophthora perniciosa FA553]|nr:hypothetical protein MPER_07310 [Moniliophthora perniciosa FA553]